MNSVMLMNGFNPIMNKYMMKKRGIVYFIIGIQAA